MRCPRPGRDPRDRGRARPGGSSWNNGREMAAPPLNVETISSRTRPSGSSITVVVSSSPRRRSRMGITSSRREASSSQVRNRYGVSSVIQSRRPGTSGATGGGGGWGRARERALEALEHARRIASDRHAAFGPFGTAVAAWPCLGWMQRWMSEGTPGIHRLRRGAGPRRRTRRCAGGSPAASTPPTACASTASTRSRPGTASTRLGSAPLRLPRLSIAANDTSIADSRCRRPPDRDRCGASHPILRPGIAPAALRLGPCRNLRAARRIQVQAWATVSVSARGLARGVGEAPGVGDRDGVGRGAGRPLRSGAALARWPRGGSGARSALGRRWGSGRRRHSGQESATAWESALASASGGVGTGSAWGGAGVSARSARPRSPGARPRTSRRHSCDCSMPAQSTRTPRRMPPSP